jgi:hypothetical protein
MEQNPSSEANRFSASQEIPCILCNPKVPYRFHWCFCVNISYHDTFLRWVVSTSPIPKLGITPCRLSSIAYSIYWQIASVWDAVPPSATWGRAMPWWQGPTYHQTRVITVRICKTIIIQLAGYKYIAIQTVRRVIRTRSSIWHGGSKLLDAILTSSPVAARAAAWGKKMQIGLVGNDTGRTFFSVPKWIVQIYCKENV